MMTIIGESFDMGLIGFLFLLSGVHVLFGKEIRPMVWRISLISSLLTGALLGLTTGVFPYNFASALIYMGMLGGFNYALRSARNKHEI